MEAAKIHTLTVNTLTKSRTNLRAVSNISLHPGVHVQSLVWIDSAVAAPLTREKLRLGVDFLLTVHLSIPFSLLPQLTLGAILTLNLLNNNFCNHQCLFSGIHDELLHSLRQSPQNRHNPYDRTAPQSAKIHR